MKLLKSPLALGRALILSLSLAAQPAMAPAHAHKPNVVFILADSVGYDATRF